MLNMKKSLLRSEMLHSRDFSAAKNKYPRFFDDEKPGVSYHTFTLMRLTRTADSKPMTIPAKVPLRIRKGA